MGWRTYLHIVLFLDFFVLVACIVNGLKLGAILPVRDEPIDATNVLVGMILFLLANAIAMLRAVDNEKHS